MFAVPRDLRRHLQNLRDCARSGIKQLERAHESQMQVLADNVKRLEKVLVSREARPRTMISQVMNNTVNVLNLQVTGVRPWRTGDVLVVPLSMLRQALTENARLADYCAHFSRELKDPEDAAPYVLEVMLELVRRVHQEPAARNVCLNLQRTDQVRVLVDEPPRGAQWRTLSLEDAVRSLLDSVAEQLRRLGLAASAEFPTDMLNVAFTTPGRYEARKVKFLKEARAPLSAHLGDLARALQEGKALLGGGDGTPVGTGIPTASPAGGVTADAGGATIGGDAITTGTGAPMGTPSAAPGSRRAPRTALPATPASGPPAPQALGASGGAPPAAQAPVVAPPAPDAPPEVDIDALLDLVPLMVETPAEQPAPPVALSMPVVPPPARSLPVVAGAHPVGAVCPGAPTGDMPPGARPIGEGSVFVGIGSRPEAKTREAVSLAEALERGERELASIPPDWLPPGLRPKAEPPRPKPAGYSAEKAAALVRLHRPEVPGEVDRHYIQRLVAAAGVPADYLAGKLWEAADDRLVSGPDEATARAVVSVYDEDPSGYYV